MATVSNQVEECFLLTLLPGFSKLGLVTEHLEHEFNKVLSINAATEDFLSGKIDEETFLDVVEYFEQDMDTYIAAVNENLEIVVYKQ